MAQGIFIITIVIILYGLSLFVYLKGKTYLSLFLIIGIGLGLRIFCSLDPMLHDWDEKYHALVAKNLIEQPLEPKLYKEHLISYDYKNWTSNKIWLHKQAVPLWTMALSMKIFGIDEFSLRIPSIFLSSLSILLTFFISLALFNSHRVGIIAAFLHSINGLVIELSSGRVATDHVDTFFLFFIELSALLILMNAKNNKKFLLLFVGISCGLAILTKWLVALIIFPLYLSINFKTKKLKTLLFDLIIIATVAILIALPWQIYTQIHFPMEFLWEQHFNAIHFTTEIEGHGQDWWYFFNRIRINVNEIIYIILLWYIYYTTKNRKLITKNIFLLIWIGIPFIVFSIATSKMQGYLLFTFPAYFIIIGFFVDVLLNKHINYSPIHRKLSGLLIILIFSLSIRYGFERIKPFETHNEERIAKKELMNIDFPHNAVLFNSSRPIELMFYTNCIAYSHIPDKTLIKSLHKSDYKLYIIEDGTLPLEIMEDKKITKMKLHGIKAN